MSTKIPVTGAAISALLQLVLFSGAPRYLLYSLVLSLSGIFSVLLWPPAMEPLLRPGSMYRAFAGLDA